MEPPFGKLNFCSRGVGKLGEGNTCFSRFFLSFFTSGRIAKYSLQQKRLYSDKGDSKITL